MTGSWAGAMGQPQFIPSSFMRWAVDFSGDGKRDIWTNVPDVLGSIANYFRKNGWTPGMPWGFEVVVPANFDFSKSRGSFAEWSALGFRRADGGAFPANGSAYLLFPERRARAGVPRHRQFRRDQALQQVGRLCARDRASRRPAARRRRRSPANGPPTTCS